MTSHGTHRATRRTDDEGQAGPGAGWRHPGRGGGEDGNAQNTSLGACSPGDEVALPWDEAQALVQAGYATRIGTVADERVTRP